MSYTTCEYLFSYLLKSDLCFNKKNMSAVYNINIRKYMYDPFYVCIAYI